MKKKIDIEKLLQWALREELPKGHPVSASPWDAISSYGSLGTRVDVSRGAGDGFGMVSGTPHPDAEIIAGMLRDLSPETRLTETECVALLGHYALLDPLAVKTVVLAPFSMRALVIRCAVLGVRMEWDCGLPQAFPAVRHNRQRWAVAFVFNKDGALCEARANGRGHYPLGAASHVAWRDPSVGQLLEARAEYVVWRRALVELARKLAGALNEHEALMPEAVAEPWCTGQVSAPVIFKNPAGRMAKLPLAPARPAALRPHESDIERRSRESRHAPRKTEPRVSA